MSDKRSSITNLLILGIAILLICNIKTKFSEMFVANVPMIPNDDGYGAQGGVFSGNYPGYSVGGHPNGNPYTFNNQIYPAKIPYYPELGRPCEGNAGCGVLGKCENGVCGATPYNKTVFGDQV